MVTEGVVQRTRQELLHELETSQAQVVQLLESMAAAQDWQPEAAEWSFRLLAGHLASVEETWHLRRVVEIAAGDTPRIDHYSDRSAGFAGQDLHASLRQWVATRRRLLDFVAGLDDRTLHQVGVHVTVGPMSILDTLAEILSQDQVNLRHIHQLIVAYFEAGASPAPDPSAKPAANAASIARHHNEAQ